MENSCFPIEICEAVMDALPDHYAPLGCLDGLLEPKKTWESQQALCACSLTCRAWRVRAQRLLWTLPHILGSQHLAQFTSAIQTRSKISTTGLVLGDHRAYAMQTFDPSTASSLFMHSFHRLRHLLCYGVLFHYGPPLQILRMRLPFFASITVLQLLDCVFQSFRAMLDVVWACPNLVTLAISRNGIKSKNPSATELRLLSSAVENLGACRRLTSLHLDAFTTLESWNGVGCVFGCAVMDLHFKTDNISDAEVLESILRASFPILNSVTVVSRVERVFGKYSKYPLSFFHTIVEALPTPGILNTIILEGDHEWEDSGCCEEMVGTQDDMFWDEERLAEVSTGLVELTIRLDMCKEPEIHATYIWSVLPMLHNVLGFEYRLNRNEDWTPYMLPVTE